MEPPPKKKNYLTSFLRNFPLRRLCFIFDDIFNLKAIEEAILGNTFLKSEHNANKNFTIKTTFCLNSSPQTSYWRPWLAPRDTWWCGWQPCFLHFLKHGGFSRVYFLWGRVRRKPIWENNFKGLIQQQNIWEPPLSDVVLTKEIWKKLLLRGAPVDCQYLRCSGVTLLLMREDSGALYMTQMGLLSGASSLSVLAGQADRLATLPLNNAILHCGQLPIRKTAETQRGE